MEFDLDTFLNDFKNGGYSPYALHKKFNMSIEKVYNILKEHKLYLRNTPTFEAVGV